MMLQHVMKVTRTWDSTMSMIPKGGDTIWGGLDWSPEEGYSPGKRDQNNNGTETPDNSEDENLISDAKHAHYGRIISFGKEAAIAAAAELKRIDFRVRILVHSKFSTTRCYFLKIVILYKPFQWFIANLIMHIIKFLEEVTV